MNWKIDPFFVVVVYLVCVDMKNRPGNSLK